LQLVKLEALMERTSGNPDVKIGLIDGPVVTQHSGFPVETLRELPGGSRARCNHANSTTCRHGTFVAGILSAKRNSPAPAICPDCTLFIRPTFSETTHRREQMPSASPQELAAAILECIDAGVRVINLSLTLAQPSTHDEQAVEEALHQALGSVIVVAASGNQRTLTSSAITRPHVHLCDDGGISIMNSHPNESQNCIKGKMVPGGKHSLVACGDDGPRCCAQKGNNKILKCVPLMGVPDRKKKVG
jgi:hypothetical protein